MVGRLKSTVSAFRPWVWAAAVGLSIIFCLVIWLIVSSLKGEAVNPEQTAELVTISAPTFTPIPPIQTLITQTSTPELAVINGIGIGIYVQIVGTDGAGLRLRSAPGTDSAALFLGMDAEVFLVKDGPRMANDMVWWYLVAPYDDTRAGWAAAHYLEIIPVEN